MAGSISQPQSEALELFAEVLRDLTKQERDLKLVLRKCQLACELLEWKEEREFFERELIGYPRDQGVPPHRKVVGKLVWRDTGSVHDIIASVVADFVHPSNSDDPDEESTTLNIWAGIDFLLPTSQNGYAEDTGETRQVTRGTFTTRPQKRTRVFPAFAFQHVLNTVEQTTFDIVSKRYRLLKYGSAITDAWALYRARVDASLKGLGLEPHLEAIQGGIQSSNPESWRSAMLECRNLLHDLAAHLWRDTRPTYEHLPGSGANKKLQVTEDKFSNRLSAYLHQKGLRGTAGIFFRAELERLGESIRAIIAFQSTAHSQVTSEDAVSTAVSTYTLIGELILRTDMEPIEVYGQPSTPAD